MVAAKKMEHQTSNSYASPRNDLENLSHLVDAGNYTEAARRLILVADNVVRRRQFAILEDIMKRLPAAILEEFPMLMAIKGDVCRLTCRFEEGLAWYVKAKKAFAKQRHKQGVILSLIHI